MPRNRIAVSTYWVPVCADGGEVTVTLHVCHARACFSACVSLRLLHACVSASTDTVEYKTLIKLL